MKLFIQKIILVLLLISGICNLSYAEKIDSRLACEQAKVFLCKINSEFSTNNYLVDNNFFEFTDNNETLAYIFHLLPHGFIAVSAFSQGSAIIGFSVDDDFPEGEGLQKLPVYTIVRKISILQKHISSSKNQNVNLKNAKTDTLYGPHVNTLWGQVNCHNNQGQLVNVTNYYTPNHYAAGCVAISLATVLHYYKWPVVGEGYHQYYDGLGSSNGSYEADFGSTWYKWDLMIDKYNNQASNDLQKEATGELAFHAAVALDMNFEYNGSTSNVNKIPATGSNYFRFYAFYKQENSSVFWPRLDKNMAEANPVILSVEDNSGYGHSIICDGLWVNEDLDRFYHLNMGWWGTGNGWFSIQGNFNASGYTVINGGILDFIPKPYLNELWIPADTNLTHLSWQFTHTIIPNAYEVQHRINSGSWETITENHQDTSLLVVIPNVNDNHYFRVRVKVNNEWYPSSWSNEVQLQIITGIADLHLAQNTNIYPNPFQDYFEVTTENNPGQNSTIRIYNAQGKLFYKSADKPIAGKLIIQTDKWQSGIYLAEIKNSSETKVFKLIKK